MGRSGVHRLYAFGSGGVGMAWYDENRMVVEGQRYQEELYAREDEEDDHIAFVHYDGTVVYEEYYGENEDGEVVYLCDYYECEECPDYKECKGKK